MGERIIYGCEQLYQTPKFNNIKEIVKYSKERYGESLAFKFKTDKKDVFKEITYNEYIDNVNALGTALIGIGLKDKKIAVISENRYEWEEAYLSIICGTGIVVPLDRSLPENEIISLIERSEVEAIFYSSKYDEVMKKVKEEKIGKIKFFISMDNEEKKEEIYSQKELVKLGKDLLKNGARSFLDAEIDNEKMAVMLFTSGTTSKSKSVVLSHKNICANVYDVASIFDLNENDTMLSFLPLHHTLEATIGFIYAVSKGVTIVFCDGLRHIADNIREYKVSAMISVPLLFENMYKKVLQAVDKKGKTKAVKFGRKLSNFLLKFGIDKRKKIFKDIHESLGGNVRLFVAGAAAFDQETEKGLNELGIETYQGYGLTETSPVIAAEHKNCSRPGSVGKILPSFEAKILDADKLGIGEIAVKGPSVMLGYYENEEATKETFTEDGWFLTGDLGYFDKDGYLFITGRKKNVIVLKNGKNIYPEELETLLGRIPSVKECFVYGKPEKDDDDLKIGAKIVIDKDTIKQNYEVETIEEVKPKIWEKVKEINKEMPKYKYIKEIIVTDEELIKTTTQKIKRFEEMKKI